MIPAGDTLLLETFGSEYAICQCADSVLGMGHSIACGVRATAAADGWLILLADMPFVQVATIAGVAARLRRADQIIRPRFGDTFGHPVAFGRRYRDALLALTGDTGGAEIVQTHAAYVECFDVADEGILRDVDRPDDLPSARL